MYENFTDRARKVMQLANQEAQRFNQEYIGPEHILLGLVKEGSGVAANVLKNLDVDLRRIRLEVEKLVQSGPDMVTMGKLPNTPRAKKVLEYTSEASRNLNQNYVGTEHVLLGLLREQEGIAAQVLVKLGLKFEIVQEEILNLLGQGLGEEGGDRATSSDHSVPKKSSTPALDSFGRDLTVLAGQNKLDPVIGREREMNRVIQILCRRQTSNPVLLGVPGVGKSTIVDGLAQKIARHDVPNSLTGKRLVALDAAMMVVGTKYRGQFEERIKAVTNEVRRAKNVILFIDDLHSLVAASTSIGNFDAFSILRTALLRGEMQCIGATTPDEYRTYIESHAAWELPFQTVQIEPASPKTAVDILMGLRERFEEYHRLQITDEAITSAVQLSSWYTNRRCLPQAAIDIIDESCARLRLLSHVDPPPAFHDLDEKVDQLLKEREEAVANQDFERAASLRDQSDKLRREKETLVRDWRERSKPPEIILDDQAVLETLSDLTGMDVDAIRNLDSVSTSQHTTTSIITGLPSFERRQCESILQGSDVRIAQGTGFVLMPHTTEFREIFDNVIHPAMSENGIHAMLAEDIYSPGSILNQVWSSIRSSEVIVADISGLNRNVIFELGLCFGVRRFPIILLRDPAELPFNLQMLRYIKYVNTAAGAAALREELSATVQGFLAASRGSLSED